MMHERCLLRRSERLIVGGKKNAVRLRKRSLRCRDEGLIVRFVLLSELSDSHKK